MKKAKPSAKKGKTASPAGSKPLKKFVKKLKSVAEKLVRRPSRPKEAAPAKSLSKPVSSKPAAASKNAPSKPVPKAVAKSVSKAAPKARARSQKVIPPVASIREGVPMIKSPLPEDDTAIVAEVPSAPAEQEESRFELPSHYGDDKIVLLVRDPWWIYAYWEVSGGREAEVTCRITESGAQRSKTILRVYDVTGSSVEAPRSSFDIEVAFLVGNWYVDVGIPDRDWVAELGFRASDGCFHALVRSNVVRTPRFGVSDVVDEEWMFPDETYWKVFGLSGGLADRRSSLDVKEILQKYLRSIVSSEGMSNYMQNNKMLRNESRVDVSAKISERP